MGAGFSVTGDEINDFGNRLSGSSDVVSTAAATLGVIEVPPDMFGPAARNQGFTEAMAQTTQRITELLERAAEAVENAAVGTKATAADYAAVEEQNAMGFGNIEGGELPPPLPGGDGGYPMTAGGGTGSPMPGDGVYPVDPMMAGGDGMYPADPMMAGDGTGYPMPGEDMLWAGVPTGGSGAPPMGSFVPPEMTEPSSMMPPASGDMGLSSAPPPSFVPPPVPPLPSMPGGTSPASAPPPTFTPPPMPPLPSMPGGTRPASAPPPTFTPPPFTPPSTSGRTVPASAPTPFTPPPFTPPRPQVPVTQLPGATLRGDQFPRVPKVEAVRNPLDTDLSTTRPVADRALHKLLPVNPPDLFTRSGAGGGGTPPVSSLGIVSDGGFGGPPPPGPPATFSSLSPAPPSAVPVPPTGGPQLGMPGGSGGPPPGGMPLGGTGPGGGQGDDQERKTASYIKGEDLFTMTEANPPPPVIGDTPTPTPPPAN
jgi:hypothetical protein